MADNRDTGTTIDLQNDNENSHGLQVDAAALAAGAFYGLPLIGLSFAKAAAIQAQAEFAKRLDGAENFIRDAGSGGPIDGKTRAEQEKEAGERAFAYTAAILDEFEREQQRQREEWERTSSTIGGVTKTGAEWSAFAKRLREDDRLRQDTIEAFISRGMTRAQAERRFDRVVEIAEIAAIPPSQRTDEQNQKVEATKGDPTFNQDVQTIDRLAGEDAKPRSALATSFPEAATGGTPQAGYAAIDTEVGVTKKDVLVRPAAVVDGLGF